MGKAPPHSPYDSRPGSWSRGTVLLIFVIVAAVCGALAYLKGLS